MKANTVSPRTAILCQFEAAMHLLSQCEDSDVASIALETAAFLVGSGTSALSDSAEVRDNYEYLSTIEKHIVRTVDRIIASDPSLPDIGHATEEYRREQERRASLRVKLDDLESKREKLRREIERFSLREQETAEEIAIMERQFTLLKDHLKGCKEKAESLSELYRATASPFEAMSSHLGEQDFPSLCRTLDADVMKEYKTLSDEVARRLEKLNALLSACSRAVQSDQSALENRLEKRGKAS